MFVDDIIDRADNWIDSDIPLEEKVLVINRIEDDFYTKRFFKYEKDTIDVVAGQDTYSLSSKGYSFADIEQLKVGGFEYKKMSLRDNYQYCYYASGTNIVINPKPVSAETDGIEIIHLYKPSVKATGSIETDTLEIIDDFGDKWANLYLYGLLHQYSLFNRDFGLANNYAMYFNNEESKLHEYVSKHYPSTVAELRKNPNYWR
jgi:hypothetical protein